MPEYLHTESDFGKNEDKESLGKLSLANISNIKQTLENATGFFTSDMGAHQMQRNIDLLDEMLPESQPPKKVFRKKKLRRTGELKRDKSQSKSRKRREATGSTKKKAKKDKKARKNTKSSTPKEMVKSQSIQLLGTGELTRQEVQTALESPEQGPTP